MAPSSYQDVLKLAKENKCQFIDLKFIDLPGTWQHYTLPIKELADLFENATALTALPSAVSAQFMKATCCYSPTRPLQWLTRFYHPRH